MNMYLIYNFLRGHWYRNYYALICRKWCPIYVKPELYKIMILHVCLLQQLTLNCWSSIYIFPNLITTVPADVPAPTGGWSADTVLTPVQGYGLLNNSVTTKLLDNIFKSRSHHYRDVIMSAMASPITSLTIVYATVYSGADQREHQSSASLALVRGIHRWPVNSP